MIERQFFSAIFGAAILADVAVSGEDVDAGKLYGAVAVLQPDQLEKPHDSRQLERDRHSVDLSVVDLEDFNLALPQESDRFLPMNDTQGFVRRVEQEGHFHSTTSFPTEAPIAGRAFYRSGLRSVMFYAIRFA